MGGFSHPPSCNAPTQTNTRPFCAPSVSGPLIADFEIAFHFDRKKMLNMTLDSIPTQVSAQVVSVDATGRGGLRLMEMGIVPGARVLVLNRAPLGDPIRIFVSNYHLALRREEARSIEVALFAE